MSTSGQLRKEKNEKIKAERESTKDAYGEGSKKEKYDQAHSSPGATLNDRSVNPATEKNNENNQKPRDEAATLRDITRQKAQSRMDRIKNQARNKVDEKLFNPAKKGTGTLLKMAWEALIPSFGLSIIYLDLHVFLRYVTSDKLFCKLGEEWLPESVGELGGAKGMAELVETMVLIFVNLVYWGVILSIVALIVMVMGWVAHPIDAIMNLGWGAVSALSSLFKGLL